MAIYSEEIVMTGRMSLARDLSYERTLVQETDLEKSNYLEHHGIKGQRWGVRRYQNSDGSLTNAGRKRYGIGGSKYKIVAKSPFEKQQAKLKEQEKKMTQREEIQTRKNQLKEREARLKDLGKSEETLRKEEMKRLEKELKDLRKQDEKEAEKAAKKEKEKKERERKEIAEEQQKRQNRKTTEMTDEEIRAFINRYKLEKEYKQLTEGPPKKGIIKSVSEILVKSGGQAIGDVSKEAMAYGLRKILDMATNGDFSKNSKGDNKNDKSKNSNK